MHIVGQRQTRAAPASMAQIATDPDRVNLGIHSGLQKRRQSLRAQSWSIFNIMHEAAIRIGIKNILEAKLTESTYE